MRARFHWISLRLARIEKRLSRTFGGRLMATRVGHHFSLLSYSPVRRLVRVHLITMTAFRPSKCAQYDRSGSFLWLSRGRYERARNSGHDTRRRFTIVAISRGRSRGFYNFRNCESLSYMRLPALCQSSLRTIQSFHQSRWRNV